MAPPVFALVSQTMLVSPSELYHLAEALEVNAAHCADAYLLERPEIVVVADVGRSLEKLPAGCYPLLFVDDDGADGSTLGSHWWLYDRQIPVGRVIVNIASGLNTGRYSVAEIASHEITEALCNPTVGVWLPHPTRPGVEVAYECADPVQTHYEITIRGTPWKMANFVTPHWYRAEPLPGSRFDHSGELTAPGQIGAEGYAMLRPAGGGEAWAENRWGRMDAAKLPYEKQAALRHRLSRSRKLGLAI